jgi:uncharacterized membrane protein YeaQ/YmgE (transglycosylase-associated protein family)
MAVLKPLPTPVTRFLVPAPLVTVLDQNAFRRPRCGDKLDRRQLRLQPVCTPTPFEPDVLFYCSRNHRSEETAMSIIGWVILGLISGFIASKIVNRTGEGFFLDIVLGIVGAVVGGFIFTAVGATGVTGFNLYSMFVAVIGAIVVLVLYHALFSRRAY